MRSLRPLLLPLVAVALLIGPIPHFASGSAAQTYVALGDSYTSGPLVPLPDAQWRCFRSTSNYANLLAQRLGLSLRDASCALAKTQHMAQSQDVTPSPNPPQLDRLDAGVGLVTLQIGASDLGLFGIAQSCGKAIVGRTNCRDHFVNNGRDELRDRIAATAPKLAAILDEIHVRSPLARVLVLGYPAIFRLPSPGPAGCTAMGVSEIDAQYLRGVEEALNAMIAEQAASHQATYVDVYNPTAGKTACDLPVFRWVEPLVPAAAAAPVHPNLNGMAGIADLLEDALATSG